jgi:hypothetical protein
MLHFLAGAQLVAAVESETEGVEAAPDLDLQQGVVVAARDLVDLEEAWLLGEHLQVKLEEDVLRDLSWPFNARDVLEVEAELTEGVGSEGVELLFGLFFSKDEGVEATQRHLLGNKAKFKLQLPEFRRKDDILIEAQLSFRVVALHEYLVLFAQKGEVVAACKAVFDLVEEEVVLEQTRRVLRDVDARQFLRREGLASVDAHLAAPNEGLPLV